MTLFLLRYYWKLSSNFTDNRALLMPASVLPIVVVMAWAFPGTGGIWIATTLTVLLGGVTPQRPTRFEAALPIPGRDIAIARLISALLVTITPILLAVTTIVPTRHVPFPAFETAAALSISVLAVLLPRLVKSQELTVAPVGTLTPIFLAGIAAFAAIMTLEHWQSLTLLFVATIAVAVWWWRSVPEAFQVAPVSATSRAEGTSGAEVSDIANGVAWWKVLRRTVFTKNRVFVSIMMIFGGAFGNWQLFLFLLLIMEDLWQRTRWMQSMPLSHRARLSMILVPGVFIPLIFLLVGLQIHTPFGWDYSQGVHRNAISTYQQEPRYFNSPTSVSLDYWEKSKDDVPVLTAPWGETVQPYVVHIFGRTYYNPYTAREASSEQFTNWQFERLTTAFYGVPLVLKSHDDGQINPRRLNAAPRMMVLNIATGLVLVFLYMFGTGFVRWHKAWAHQKAAGTVALLTMFVPMGLWLYTMVVYGFTQGAMNVLLPLFERQLMNLSAVLPSNILVVFVVAAAPVLAAYTLLEWQFKNSEVVGPVIKF